MKTVLTFVLLSLTTSALGQPARDVVTSSGIQGGLVVHVGSGAGPFMTDLLANDRFIVHELCSDPAETAKAREHIKRQGLYGKASVQHWNKGHLPYTDNLVNLLVAEDLGDISMREVMRVLAPRGVACVKSGETWKKTTKPWPEEIDEWTHYLHGPDNNAVARDTRVGLPKYVQWIGDPKYARSHEQLASVSAMVSARGRLFYVIDEGLIVYGTNARCLGDLDAVAIGQFINGLKKETTEEKLAGRTRNDYITSITGMTKWAVINRRLPHDPLVGLQVIEPKNIEPTRPKRALSTGELVRLLDAAERRPLIEVQTIRIGPRKGQQVANVSPRVKKKVVALGRERRMVYLTGTWTGLRRSELRALRWGDIHLDTVPAHIPLRKSTTKSKRADTLPIHSQLADELRKWKPADATANTPVFHAIPNMKAFRADLALAGIPDVDEQGYFVVFHGLRVTASTRFASHEVTQRASQALMRHRDPRLTAGTYTDERLLPLAAELEKVPPIPTTDEVEGKTISLPATGTENSV